MPPKRRRPKVDPDIVKTEKDYGRATGREDENDFVIEEQKVNLDEKLTLQEYVFDKYTNKSVRNYKRSKLRGEAKFTDTNNYFPFLTLPAEIRNMIYRYLVLSHSNEPIELDPGIAGKFYKPGGIQTAILCTNQQIFNEAAKILYDENKCIAIWNRNSRGVVFRVDEEKTKSSTSRALRSGRAVDMIKYTGFIYENSFKQLKNVEFRVEIFSRVGLCDHVTLHFGMALQEHLWTLFSICHERESSTHAGADCGRNWEIVIEQVGEGGHCRTFLQHALEPLLDAPINKTIKLGKMSMRLKGKWAKNWRNVFRGVRGLRGFSIKDLEEIELGRKIPQALVEMFFEEDMGFWW